MKFLTVMTLILSANFAFAGTSGANLKKAVVQMNTCYGVRDLDGVFVNFYADNTAYINSVSFANDAPADLVSYPYTRDNLYSRYMIYGSVQDSIQTTWRVKGTKVLVRLAGPSKAEYSLTIGFKSFFCSSN